MGPHRILVAGIERLADRTARKQSICERARDDHRRRGGRLGLVVVRHVARLEPATRDELRPERIEELQPSHVLGRINRR